MSAQSIKSDRASDSSADRVMEKISESKLRRNPIPLFILVSVLVHGIGLVLFSFIERSQPRVQLVPETAPIDFVIVPPEESASTIPTNPSPQEEIPAQKLTESEPSIPEATVPETTEPITPSQAVVVPEPVTESVPKETVLPEKIIEETPPQPESPSQTITKPEPIPESLPQEILPKQEITAETLPTPEPIPESLPKLPKEIKTDPLPQPETVNPPLPSNLVTEGQNSPEILTGSDTTVEETETKIPEITKREKLPANIDEPEIDSVANNTPPKITPTKPLETEESPSNVTESENNSVVTPLPPKITPSKPLETESPSSTVTEPENSSIATSLPPKITSPQSLETKPPTVPNQNLPASSPNSANQTPKTTGAASLLGGNLKRSFEDDGGSSFFNLENNVSQQAYNPRLDAQQRLDMRNYFAEIKRRVKRNWNPRYSTREHTTVLSFSIQRNGQISLLQVRRTSGSQTVDREALEAVQKSGPFDPLPTNYPSEMLNVEFNFNIYIY